MQTKGEKAVLFIRDNIGYFIIILVLGIYILKGLIEIQDTGKTVEQIIVDGAIAWILGFSIGRVFERQGIISGNKDKRVISTKELHAQMITDVGGELEFLEPYCQIETDKALKTARVHILTANGLKYETYFDKEGVAIQDAFNVPKSKEKLIEKRNKAKRKTLAKALKTAVTPLSTNSLTGNTGKAYDPFNFGINIKDFQRRSALTDIFYKLVIGGVFGYYGVRMLADPDWAYVIWTSIQAATFLIAGVLKYLSALLFVVDDMRGRTIKQMDNLQKFKNTDKAKFKEVA